VQVIGKIELLAGDPHAAGEAKVVGFEEIYRVREGNYRVVYTRASNRILILLVHNRKDVYRELKRQGYR
jgi:mRNA interferase RelE/StbE